MNWEKITPLIFGSVIIVVFSTIPNSFGGTPDSLCFAENLVEVSCDDPTCVFGEIGECRLPDEDDDNIPDEDDNCPFISNSGQEDTDENGIGDACQDTDADEILDLDDNCPFISNPNQDDTDENGIGDACEAGIELLVEATFPPGDTVSVELPEDPDTGVFSISLELPETEGGNVVIEITDAGDTPGNFSFLGFIIDFNAPCSGVCEISFTFTQASLNEQGITIDQVTIFHDMNENGSFENDEAIPTIITGSDPFTATANAAFTSKFSVGGVKALFLGALGGGGSSRGGSSPTLENLSFDGVRTVNEDGTIGFGGLIIDEILSENNFPTQTIETGTPFELRFPFYEDNGAKAIQHVAVYVLHDGKKTINDSELYLIYDREKPLQTYDPHGFISNSDVNIVEKSSHLVDIIFEITFELPMEQSDIIVRAWDTHRRSSDYKFNQLIQVVDANPSTNLMENMELNSLDNTTDNIVETSENNSEIPLWIKFNANWWSHDEISDDDFVAGIKYLIDDNILIIPEVPQVKNEGVTEIPAWVKSNAGWWAEDSLSDEEFLQAIQWIIEEGIMPL